MKKYILTSLLVLVVVITVGCQTANANNNYASPVCSATYDTIFPTICQGDTFKLGGKGFTLSGTFNDTLTNAHGCDSVVTLHLLVTQAPGAGFVANAGACINQPDTIIYTGLYVGTPVFNWNFDGATIQSGANDGPYALSWSTPGLKTITLTVTSNGCTSLPDTGFVTVGSAAPTATFTATSPVCGGQNSIITYTGTAGNGAVFNWNFGSGQANTSSGPGPILVTWPQPDTANVILTVNDNGCLSAADTEQVFVYAIPSSTFTISSGTLCPNTPATITYTGSGTGNAIYNWNFDGGSIVAGTGQGPYLVSWPTGGQQNISLTVVENGCSSPPTSNVVTVNAAPVVTFSFDSMLANLNFMGYLEVGKDTIFCFPFGGGQFILTGGRPAGGYYSGTNVSGDTISINGFPEAHVPFTYTYTDNNGCAASISDTMLGEDCLGIPTINATTNLFTLYPNPADDYTTLNFDAAYTGAIIMIKDITGRQLYTTHLTTSPQQIPTSNLPPGVYLVTMYSNGESRWLPGGERLLVKE